MFYSNDIMDYSDVIIHYSDVIIRYRDDIKFNVSDSDRDGVRDSDNDRDARLTEEKR